MKSNASAVEEIVADCLAVRVRTIARVVSAIYDRAVERHGVSIAQLNLLAALGKIGPCAPGALGAALRLERSTVSRNLEPLLRNGWVLAEESDAKGIRRAALTEAGRRKIGEVLVDWRKAQREAERLLGDDGTRAVRSVAGNLIGTPSE